MPSHKERFHSLIKKFNNEVRNQYNSHSSKDKYMQASFTINTQASLYKILRFFWSCNGDEGKSMVNLA